MGIVKQLVWDEAEPDWWEAESPTVRLSYEVRLSPRTGNTRLRLPGQDWQNFDGTVEKAQAFCQFDYETRIEECLDYEPGHEIRDLGEFVAERKGKE